ncbi:hypothetical protein LOC54_03125 [Acetobacter sp. AN02]|uniref:hypothetical protein n=1 Tax=Acetobacter sp. AN02 TaxID=2894186 RepID=UPI0024345340|nr:hypothetical protein [Acetobacter sp. AN02]MDG6094115.1 hypothetical protein [Acetobacter sp. AN02]
MQTSTSLDRYDLENILLMENRALPPRERAEMHYHLWEICQAEGKPDLAMSHLAAAMLTDPLRMAPETGTPPARTILAINAAGTFQTNLPLGMLLDDTTRLHTLWLPDNGRIPERTRRRLENIAPQLDCIFLCIAEDAALSETILAADRLARKTGVPVIGSGEAVLALSRTGAASVLPHSADIILPQCRRISMADSTAAAAGLNFPVLMRPVSSHAGRKLVKAESIQDWQQALKDYAQDEDLFVTDFTDYRGPDGLWRKYRAVFVEGRPFPVHMAIHTDWAVWYYKARMELYPERRAEETLFLTDMQAATGERAARVLEAIGRAVPLDYFGLDFGVDAQGRLIVFEVETGMIVHDQDSPDVFPYKREPVRKIRQAVEAMADRRAGRC